jgi:hypothetical protein
MILEVMKIKLSILQAHQITVKIYLKINSNHLKNPLKLFTNLSKTLIILKLTVNTHKLLKLEPKIEKEVKEIKVLFKAI